MTEPLDRERYDRTWAVYPYEHPAAYWLRAGAHGMICTRCGKSEPASVSDEGAVEFADQHLACPLGFGMRVPRPSARPSDPMFATA